MSKRGFISRYLLIIKKLKAKPYCRFEEMQQYIDQQVEFLQDKYDTFSLGFSKRTLQRDLREIRELFGIEIEYSSSQKGYAIVNSEGENMNFQRMIEMYDTFSSLNLAHDLSPFIHLEKRRPQGTENLYGLVHAIKKQLQIHFTYQKYWDDEISQRLVEPYALKEFENRWYVLANDLKDRKIKSFALDRLTELEITKKSFQDPKEFDVNAYYKDSFGIISPNGMLPEEIVLSFDAHEGKYIKSLPLHESQVVLADNEKELRIGLTLVITRDFLMEILSHGEMVQVIKPANLIHDVKTALQNALNLY
jgi:predicted DNA-binding transcriptional regulator YafY